MGVLGATRPLLFFCLAILLKIGSSLVVKSHQFGTETEIVALWGDFFACGSERLPAVFLGGVGKLPCRRHGLFVDVGRSRHAPRSLLGGIMVSAIQNHQGDFSI